MCPGKGANSNAREIFYTLLAVGNTRTVLLSLASRMFGNVNNLTLSPRIVANCGFFQNVSWAARVKIHVMDLRQKTFVWLTLKRKCVNFASVYPGTVLCTPKSAGTAVLFSQHFFISVREGISSILWLIWHRQPTEKADYLYLYALQFVQLLLCTLKQANSETSMCLCRPLWKDILYFYSYLSTYIFERSII